MQKESSVSTVSVTDHGTKKEMAKEIYHKIDWKGSRVPKTCNLDSNELRLLDNGDNNLADILDNKQQAAAYCSLLMSIADKCGDYLEAQLWSFYTIEQILGIGLEISNDSSQTHFGTHHAPLFYFPDGSVNHLPFSRALRSPDHNLQKSAAIGLATLLSINNRGDAGRDAMLRLVGWVSENLAHLAPEACMNAVPILKIVVKDSMGRAEFLRRNGVPAIITLLNKLGTNGNAQWIYELCFVIWATTLNTETVTAYFSNSGVAASLVHCLANSPSRKITRVVVAALNNLAALKDAEILTQMLAANLERVLTNISGSAIAKHSSDPEFDADLAALTDNLNKNFRDLSSFDRWVAEVNSSTLRWGVVHTEKFWRENFKSIEQNNFESLKRIIDLLSSTDPIIVCIALNDIGEIARFYPNGRLLVAKHGGKDAAMAHLKSDPHIERYALQCVSKIMVENWESLK